MHNASTGTEMATTTVVARAALVALLLLAVALVQSTGKCFELLAFSFLLYSYRCFLLTNFSNVPFKR